MGNQQKSGEPHGIFIGGSGRSGTTILAEAFGQHPDVFLFMEPRFLADAGGLTDYVNGDVDYDSFNDKMLNHFIPVINHQPNTASTGEHFTPYNIRKLMDGVFVGSGVERVAAGRQFVDTLFGSMMRNVDKKRWVEKTPPTIEHADVIHSMFPNMRYIHIHRDPRDIYCSIIKKTWGPSTLDESYVWYTTRMEKAYEIQETIPHTNYFVLGLASLLQHSEYVMKHLLSFTGLRWNADILKKCISVIDGDKAHMNRWKSELSTKNAATIMTNCGEIYNMWRQRGKQCWDERCDRWEEVAPNVYMFHCAFILTPETISTQQALPVVPKPVSKPAALKKPTVGKPEVRKRGNPAKFAPISIVMMTHNRNGVRLRNTLDSLLVHQNVPPIEVLIVDTSTDKGIATSIAQVVSRHPNARLIRRERAVFNKSLALNVGIRSTQDCAYVACMDMDVMLSRNFIQTVVSVLNKRKAFVLTDTQMIMEHVDKDPFENWNILCGICPVAHPRGPGSFQATNRQWWMNAHGYDERFDGGLGGMDDNMWIRARRGGLEIVWIEPGHAQALHQWHPPSPLKGKTSHLFSVKTKVVANPKGWGK